MVDAAMGVCTMTGDGSALLHDIFARTPKARRGPASRDRETTASIGRASGAVSSATAAFRRCRTTRADSRHFLHHVFNQTALYGVGRPQSKNWCSHGFPATVTTICLDRGTLADAD